MSRNSENLAAMQAQMTREAARTPLLQVQAASPSAGKAMHAGKQPTWETMRAALKKVSADLGK